MKLFNLGKLALAFGLSINLGVFTPSMSIAAEKCESIFRVSKATTAAADTTPPGLFHKLKNRAEFKSREPQIRKMIHYLLLANRKVPAIEDILSEITPENPFNLRLTDLHEKSNYAVIEISTYTGNILELRTNGYFVFLSMTYRYRSYYQSKNYFAVGIEGEFLKTHRQTDLILSTLPDKIVLSRVMVEAERDAWLGNGKFVSSFGEKVHFAPNHFRYKNSEPYRIEISKKQLLKFHERNELEINIYDTVNTDTKRMQTTELGLEFEYVFIGKNAIDELRPIMKNQLRQGILNY